MPVFLLLLLGIGGGYYFYKKKQEAAAQNVLGQSIPVGKRSILGNAYGTEFIVGPGVGMNNGKWEWETYQGETTVASGVAATRKEAFNKALADALARAPQGDRLGFDFREYAANPEERIFLFSVEIIKTSGGYLAQVLDPRATVQLLQTYPNRSAAISAAYNFVEAKGY